MRTAQTFASRRGRSADALLATAAVCARSDVQMTQFIISLDDQKPQRRASRRGAAPLLRVQSLTRCDTRPPRSEKFIIHKLDDRHLLVQQHVVEDIQARAAS